jgi:hypothetical protein
MRLNTPSLDSAAGPTVARTKPTNPYLTPKSSRTPPCGESPSPTRLTDKGVEDNDHRPLPLPAPDDETSNNLLVSLLDEDLPMLVALHTTGHRTTPLEKAITKVDTVPTSTVATKFPPEFFHVTKDQTVISGMGEDVSPAAMGNLNRKPLTVIPPSHVFLPSWGVSRHC